MTFGFPSTEALGFAFPESIVIHARNDDYQGDVYVPGPVHSVDISEIAMIATAVPDSDPRTKGRGRKGLSGFRREEG